jgi:hypothetical protein
MKFLFKYPTRGRPQWFRETLCAYYQMLSAKHEYQFIIAMDNNDEKMNNNLIKSWLNNQKNLTYYYADHKNKIQACNTGIPNNGWDILVLVSDDMTPIVQGFDDIIARDMQREFPNLDGVLQYKDGLRPDKDTLMTLSIIGRKFYERYGWVYYPSYHSQWCDNDITSVAKSWKKIWHSDLTIIRHEWKKNGTDRTYEISDADFSRDFIIYKNREKTGFPLSFSHYDEDRIIRRYFKDKFDGHFLSIVSGEYFSNTNLLLDMGWTGIHIIEDMNWQTIVTKHGINFDFINLGIEGDNLPILRSMPDEYRKRAKLICIKHNGQIDSISGRRFLIEKELEPCGFNIIHTTGENVILGK